MSAIIEKEFANNDVQDADFNKLANTMFFEKNPQAACDEDCCRQQGEVRVVRECGKVACVHCTGVPASLLVCSVLTQSCVASQFIGFAISTF